MPLYRCSVSPGLTSYEQRSRIAKEVTRIHCEITDALPIFVHTFFGEDRDGRLPPGKRAFLLGSIRAGRSPEQKQRLGSELTSALASILGISAGRGRRRHGRRARALGDGGRRHPARARRRGRLARETTPSLGQRSRRTSPSISARVKPKRASTCAPCRSSGRAASGSRTGERTSFSPRSLPSRVARSIKHGLRDFLRREHGARAGFGAAERRHRLVAGSPGEEPAEGGPRLLALLALGELARRELRMSDGAAERARGRPGSTAPTATAPPSAVACTAYHG